MAFEDLKENADNIQNQIQSYIESNLAYYKLRSFKLAMKSTTMILKFALITFCLIMVLLFFSMALAFAIGIYFESYVYGFLCVGGIYLVITTLLFFVRDKIVEGPILEKFSEIFFND